MTDPRTADSGDSVGSGYRMPAEWEPHRGTWLSWPHKETSWPGRFERVPNVFAEIVRSLSTDEEVHINVGDEDLEESARAALRLQGVVGANVFFHRHPTDDAWCRDHGPIFVHRTVGDRREELILDWGYNSWGGKYPPFDLDDRIPSRIGEELGIQVVSPGMILEGGSIEVNGVGTLLTTEACLLNPNRNASLDRSEIEAALMRFLGVQKVLWLGEGIAGDDTDGHVDDLARFVDRRTVVTVVEEDPDDSNHGVLEENRRRLAEMTDQDGEPLRVIPLPMPRPLWYDGHRLPASYANFYIGNGVVLMPAYDPERDEQARTVLQELFPRRLVVPIDSTDLAWGLGACHCVTQQWPQI